jgi:uncharacterized membrane protein
LRGLSLKLSRRRRPGTLSRVIVASVIALTLAAGIPGGPAAAQAVAAPSAPPSVPPSKPPAAAEGTASGEASALMSATKATTYKLGTAFTNMLILTAGTGIVGGTLLTAFVTGESWLVYGVNDYLWDTYAPKAAPRADGSFDAKESAWRATEKWLTYKPVVSAFKFGAIYVWTGSVPIMLTLGTLTIVANTGVFYANNIGWDLYEWWNTPIGAPAATGAQRVAAP